jgi:hypothetical protein
MHRMQIYIKNSKNKSLLFYDGRGSMLITQEMEWNEDLSAGFCCSHNITRHLWNTDVIQCLKFNFRSIVLRVTIHSHLNLDNYYSPKNRGSHGLFHCHPWHLPTGKEFEYFSWAEILLAFWTLGYVGLVYSKLYKMSTYCENHDGEVLWQ